MGKHKAFHEGIARQAIGTMQPGASHFTYGIEPRETGGGIQVRGYTAHPVMSGRGNRNRLFQWVQAELAAAVKNGGEAGLRLFAWDSAEIKPHLSDSLTLHGLDKRSAHQIAR